MSTHKEVLEDFLQFENENDLLSWEIENIPVWEISRTIVFTKITKRLVNESVVKTPVKWSERFKTLFSFTINAIIKNPFLKVTPKEILILNHPRRKKNNGIYEDLYIDPIISLLQDDFIVLEGFVNINKGHYSPVQTPNLLYLDILQILGKISRKIPFNNQLNSGDSKKIRQIKNEIHNKWGIEILDLEKEIIHLIKRWKITERLVNKLLNRLQPSLILNVVSYSFMNQVFTYLAKKKNIPVIELQHGTIGKYHINYNYSNLNSLRTFPDYFLTWGENWTSKARLPLPLKNIRAVGFPYLEKQKNSESSLIEKQILVISQYRKDIAYFTQELAELLPEYKVLYKAHPAEYDFAITNYSKIFTAPNIEILADDNRNLYQLFQESECVLGVSSTALVESFAFCPKVGIIKLPRWEYFEDFPESAQLKFLSNVNQAVFFIKENQGETKYFDSSSFFKKNSVENIAQAIAELKNP